MAFCKCGCGREVRASTGYKPREWFSDACRMRVKRAAAQLAAKQAHPTAKPRARGVPIASLGIVPGDPALVDRVRDVVTSKIDADDDVAQAQGALALRLAELAADGSVSACRELRLALLEARVASDPGYEGTVSQALFLEALLLSLGSVPMVGIGPAVEPLPPGWRSTAEDGEILDWIGAEWMRLRDAGDMEGFHDLQQWIGVHAVELYELRESGRWSRWPDDRNSL